MTAFTDRARVFLPGYNLTDDQLLDRMIRIAAQGHGQPSAPRWSHVGRVTGHGSGFSSSLCRAAGLDPNEIVGIDDERGEE